MNLTTEQLEAVRRGEAVRVRSPEVGQDVILILASTLEEWQADEEEKAILEFARKQAVRVARENPY